MIMVSTTYAVEISGHREDNYNVYASERRDDTGDVLLYIVELVDYGRPGIIDVKAVMFGDEISQVTYLAKVLRMSTKEFRHEFEQDWNVITSNVLEIPNHHVYVIDYVEPEQNTHTSPYDDLDSYFKYNHPDYEE